jgi:hypothetical protein
MKHRGLIITAIAVGTVIFVATRPQAEDRKSSWTPIFFNSGECDGVSADVTGSKARLAWDGSDHVTIAVPAKSRWRRGEGTDVELRGNADDLERIRLEKGTLKRRALSRSAATSRMKSRSSCRARPSRR